MQKKLTAKIEKCETCGSNMLFNPDYQTLDCPACKSKKTIDSVKGLFKHDFDHSNKMIHHKNEKPSQEAKSMQCQNCGASAVIFGNTVSTTCSYCETKMVANQEGFDGLKPDSIIPFQFGKEKAVHLFKEKLKNKWFAPSNFKKSINTDDIKSYYFPAFIFDADCSTTYKGRLYRDETVRRSDGSTDTERDYFMISGQKETKHRDIEIETSLNLSQNELNLIKPYDFKAACKYEDEFIYGFSLEYHSNSVAEAHKQAKNVISSQIKRTILSSYHYDGVSYLDLNPTFYNEKFSYCVLPMYRINFSYKNKKYSNIMNGQTGKLSGSYPKSGVKITFVVLLLMLIFVLPILLVILFA